MSINQGDKYDTKNPKPEETSADSLSVHAEYGNNQITNATRLRRRRTNTPSHDEPKTSNNEFGDTFGVDIAEKAKGNFLITIGFPGSGKSSFHSHIYRMCEEIHHVEPINASGQKANTVDPVMESRLNAWRRRYHTREHVERTESGEANIFEIAFRVTPKTRQNLPLDLRVIEVSGEDLRKLDNSASGASVAEIPQAIGALLTDEKLNERKVIVAVMVDPDLDADPIEFLVDGFLSYMNVHGPRRLKATKFCIVVPKPLKILEALQEYKKQYPDLWEKHPRRPTLEAYRSAKDVDGSITSFYLSVFKKNLVRRLMTVAAKDGVMRTQFYLGEIEQQFTDEEGQEVAVEVLTTINYRDAATVFNFIYEGFTGKKIKPGALDRLRGK